MVMRQITFLLLFIFSSQIAIAQEIVTGAIYGPEESSGFNISIEVGSKANALDVAALQKGLSLFTAKFPNFMNKIRQNGFTRIIIRAESPLGDSTIAAAYIGSNQIMIFPSYFAMLKTKGIENSSLANIVLFHELIHAYDATDALVQNNLAIIGWGLTQNISNGAFRDSNFPEFANIWVKQTEVIKTKEEAMPLISKHGIWYAYKTAREHAKKWGYPTIYSVLGGPTESFAEIGAYVALDPGASAYIPKQTIDWFKKNVLN